MKQGIILWSVMLYFVVAAINKNTIYKTKNSTVHFISDAPLEKIEARSTRLSGLFDADKGTFAFTIPISSFDGFNYDLQKTHFNENYMESGKYPKGIFKGKIIEDFDKDKLPMTVTAKGLLNIHGVERERVIKVNIKAKGEDLDIDSRFDVILSQHGIKIPRVLQMNLAPVIQVDVKMIMIKKPDSDMSFSN